MSAPRASAVETLVAHEDVDVAADEGRPGRAVLLALHGDLAHVELARDRRELAQLLAAREGDELEALGFAAQHVERLNADGARGTEQRHAGACVRHR